MSPIRGSLGHIHQLRAEVNRLIDLLLEDPAPNASSWQPPIDLVELEDRFRLVIELPGVEAEDVHLELCDQVLLIRGTKRRPAGEPRGRRFHLMERFVGAYQLRVELPRPILPAESSARLANGVLEVVLPKLVERRHRAFKIPIDEETS
jgi:HSP20 family protein